MPSTSKASSGPTAPIAGRRKLPWRYRWPDAVRDDLLARLLALNAERYAEALAQGLHGKGGKKVAEKNKIVGSITKNRRQVQQASAVQTREASKGQPEQMDLML